ncbi:MAG: hypothetical protein WCO33_01130 [bacterium]
MLINEVNNSNFQKKKNKITSMLLIVVFVFSIFFSYFINPSSIFAATLTTGSLSQSDSRPSTSNSYTTQYSGVTLSTIKCIKIVFSDAVIGGSLPSGLVTTSATLDNATTNYMPTPASWSTNVSVNGTVKITYATGETPASASSRIVKLNTITNGSVVNTIYYAQFSTFNNTDCVTSPVDSGVVAYMHTTAVGVSVIIEPALSFTIAGVASGQSVNGATTNVVSTATSVPLGNVSTSLNRVSAQDLTVTTNAYGGYVVYVKYTGALNSGTANWTNHTGSNSAPTVFPAAGVTEAFGYTTSSTTLPNGTANRFSSNKWAAFTTSEVNNPIAASSVAVANDTTRVGYQASVVSSTASGNYTTTVVFLVTATY